MDLPPPFNKINQFIKKFDRINQFVDKDVWQIDTKKLPYSKLFFVHLTRILLIVRQGFKKKQIQLGASSLVYYTLLATIPAVAIILGIARGFQIEGNITAWITERLGEQKEAANAIIKFAKTALAHTQSGVIAGIGVIILFWSAIKIFSNIESVFNIIWEVKRRRSLAKQFSDYLALMFICPFFIVVASGASVYISAQMANWDQKISFIQTIQPLLFILLNLITYIVTWLLFTFIYIFIPNTRVQFFPAFVAGIIAGTLYQIVQTLFVYFQIGISKYNAIYGTFAALPLFLIWLNLSWIIVLLGARLAYAIQYMDSYEFSPKKIAFNQKSKSFLALRITQLCIQKFREGTPLQHEDYSPQLNLPLSLISPTLQHLVRAGVLVETKSDAENVKTYIPGRPIEELTIKKVLDMINESGDSIPFSPTKETETINDSLREFGRTIEKSDANILLKDI